MNNQVSDANIYSSTNIDFLLKPFYKRTFVPPTDFSASNVKKEFCDTSLKKISEKAQNLIENNKIVQTLLSSPLSNEPFSLIHSKPNERKEKVSNVEKIGFTCLGESLNYENKEVKQTVNLPNTIPYTHTIKVPTLTKTKHYSILEHKNLVDDNQTKWLIKAGGHRFKKDQFLRTTCVNNRGEEALFSRHDTLLRVPMAKRIEKIAKKLKIEITIPRKTLVRYKSIDSKETDPSKKYFVLAEKLDLMSTKETFLHIANMEKKSRTKLAKDLSTLVKTAGIADANFRNIRFTKKKKLCIIDTEPFNLLKVKKKVSWFKQKYTFQNSVEKCGRIGLFNLFRDLTRCLMNNDVIDKKGNHFEQSARNQTAKQVKKQVKDKSMDFPTLTNTQITNLQDFRKKIKTEYDKTPKLSAWKFLLILVPFLPVIYIIGVVVKSIVFVASGRKSFSTPFKLFGLEEGEDSEQINAIKKEITRLQLIMRKSILAWMW